MKDYTEMTYLGQVRCLSRIGRLALQRYGFNDASIRLINHGENTTYRVRLPEGSLPERSTAAYADDVCLLRIHRTGYNNETSIASELMWLAALRKSGFIVPEPIRATDSALFVHVISPEIPEGRVCSLLRWMNGRFYAEAAKPVHYRLVGRVMAQLHQHAQTWTPPAGFTRRRWDWEGLFGDAAGFNQPATEVWALIPDSHRDRYLAIAERSRTAMEALGEGAETFGLIHSDLHLWNVIFNRVDGHLQAYPLDFDDCGYSHWVYDFASTLSDETEKMAWHTLRDALFEGYREIAPLPAGVEEYLDLFIAMRIASLNLWAADMTTVNPKFKERFHLWIEWGDRCLANLQTQFH